MQRKEQNNGKEYNVHKAIENLTPIVNRGENTPEEVVVSGFEILGRGDFHDAAINLGTFNGDAGWERHVQGDEIVHIVAARRQSSCWWTGSGRPSR